jgi:hypothetical protein
MIDSAHHVSPAEVFPASEWRAFTESDKQAAKAIVVLMTGIFVVGVVLYTIVLATL